MNVRVTLGRLTHLRRLLSHFVPGHPSIRRSSAFAGYQRRGRGRQSRACGTRHSCLYELSVRRRRASALCSPWHDYVHPGMAAWLHGCMAAWREAAYSHATALFGFPLVIMKREQGASARRGAFEMASLATGWLEAASARDATLPLQSQGYVATLLQHPPATQIFALTKTSPHVGCGRHLHVTTFFLLKREGSLPLAPLRQNSSFFLCSWERMPATSSFRTGESRARAWSYLERALHVHRQLRDEHKIRGTKALSFRPANFRNESRKNQEITQRRSSSSSGQRGYPDPSWWKQSPWRCSGPWLRPASNGGPLRGPPRSSLPAARP